MGDDDQVWDNIGMIRCNRDAIAQWEKFEVEANIGGAYNTIALKGGRAGKYCADEHSLIKCDRDSIEDDCEFKVEFVTKDTVALKGPHSNKYCADEGNTVACNRDAIGPWEKFATTLQ